MDRLMVHASPAILSATTVSGTMVIGLTPVFVLWWWERPGAPSYLASVLAGVAAGVGLALGWIRGAIGEGRYANLLFVNLAGISVCFALFVGLAWVRRAQSGTVAAEAPAMASLPTG